MVGACPIEHFSRLGINLGRDQTPSSRTIILVLEVAFWVGTCVGRTPLVILPAQLIDLSLSPSQLCSLGPFWSRGVIFKLNRHVIFLALLLLFLSYVHYVI